MTTTKHQTDHQLKAAIDHELAWSPEVTADHVGVSVNDGAVTLAGEVQSYPEKAAAARVTLRVHGVTGIADEIVVKHVWGARQDADIAREASEALNESVVLPEDAVKATVHNHQITLTGMVPWNFQRAAAGRAVAGLRGVSSIHNEIGLKPTLPFAATEARTKIKDALVRHAQIDADLIQVTASGTEIQLTGSVSSWAERDEAGHAAWATPGVTHVQNSLTLTF